MTDEQLAQIESELERWSGLEDHYKNKLGRLWAEEFHMDARDLIKALREERNAGGQEGPVDRQLAIKKLRQGVLRQQHLSGERIADVLDKMMGFYPVGWKLYGDSIIWQGFYFDIVFGDGSRVSLKTYVKHDGESILFRVWDASDLLNLLENHEPGLPGGRINDYSYP